MPRARVESADDGEADDGDPPLRASTAGTVARVTVLIDPAIWPNHGTVWGHLVSDTSLSELHEFARRAGIPERGFDHDHYDYPIERYDELVALGAEPVSGRELILRLRASGLRVPERDRH